MKKVLAKCVIFGMSIVVLALPGLVSPSFSDVTISGAETTTIDLDARNTGTSKIATVASGASVDTSSSIALSSSQHGWDITVQNNAKLKSAVDDRTGSGIRLQTVGQGQEKDGKITNNGSIEGGWVGIYMGAGKVVNEAGATISGVGSVGVYMQEMSGNKGTVENSGTIEGLEYGVLIKRNSNVINNHEVWNKKGGKIITKGEAKTSIGAYVQGGSIINEMGAQIRSNGGVAAEIGEDGGNVTNAGELSGALGAYFYGDNANTLSNSGQIVGTGGNAVIMGAGNDTAYLRDGSDITGNVDADNSGDAKIVGGTDDKAYLSGSGEIKNGTLVNFETIEKSGDGKWRLGGDLSSGKSISVLGGSLEASGVYTHEAGATYTVGAGTDGKAGKIVADSAVLNGGKVYVAKGLKGGSHTIVETTNGLTGKFGSLSTDSLGSRYKEMMLSYDAKNSYLNVRSNFKKLGSWKGLTSSVDDTYNNSPSNDMVTVVDELFTLNDAALSSAFDQMSGATHGVASTVAPARQGSFYQNLFGRSSGATGLGVLGLNDRESNPLTMLASGGPVTSDAGFSLARDAQKLPFGTWLKGYAVTGNRHGGDIGSRYDYTIGGAIAGFDYLINPNIRAGVALGYSKTNVDMKELQDNSDAESFQGAIYGSYVPASKDWYVDLAFAYSKNSYETKRYLNFSNIYRVVRASYDGSDISGYLEGGYRLSCKGFTVTPLASVLAMKSHVDGFTETGGGAVNLETGSYNVDSLQSGLGVKLSREFKMAKDFLFTPELGAKWLHEFGDTEANINARFADAPAGSFFVVSADTTERDAGVFSLNLTAKKGDMLNFFIGYDLGVKSDEISHGFTGGLRFNW